jgi:hypothetical protein
MFLSSAAAMVCSSAGSLATMATKATQTIASKGVGSLAAAMDSYGKI